MTFNLDPSKIGAALTPRTKAILPVHVGGCPADLDAIREAVRTRQLPVIEDAAHAFQAKWHRSMIGSLGDFTCFGFCAPNSVTTGEGGMLCTENDEAAGQCRLAARHGIRKDGLTRMPGAGGWYYEIVSAGFNYTMSSIGAAMGLAQLRKAPVMLEKRRAIAHTYTAAFSHFPHLQTPHEDARCGHAWQLYMLRLNLEMLTIDRARFIEELKKRNISAGVHYIPLHLHPYYRTLYGYKPEDFAAANTEYLRELSLPIYPRMTASDAEDVIDAVIDVLIRFER